MADEIDDLIMQIEKLRLELVEMKVSKGYSDPEIVRASQKLDKVLNEYQELVKLTKSDYIKRIKYRLTTLPWKRRSLTIG